jgi:hypothetical protein
VLAVINTNMTISPLADFGMPVSARVRVVSVRALPMTTGVVSAVAAGSKAVFVDATPVCGYRQITDGAVLEGAFPGTSAWSPPI